ncbi:hypothetical protein F0P96_08195 [Hymenobacter busanensis]|uniref:Uncharacterized protein n=1 Tax=Hymenobacter busanensis TaxID=2607656 RepID=A0A7L4ZZU5_9BACT|nr:hypothetical protein [Hymenobacter busanensis]KAA9332960.1 hypothetical protein F0P96_08195 [Hymenobacter busanensis]QHJ08366.1 hypothetical protein GUY19_14135 [Hymenobacter busanensis]
MPFRYALAWSAVCLSAALVLGRGAPAMAQTPTARPDSVAVAPGVVRPDSVQAAAASLVPDAPETPLRPRTRWIIVGACALITLSTLLLYNVRSR